VQGRRRFIFIVIRCTSDIRGVIRYCDSLCISVLPLGSVLEYCQVIAMLWVRVLHYEEYFWNYNYYSVLSVIDILHHHFFIYFYQRYLKLAYQDQCLLNLSYVREVKIYVRISLAHLHGSVKSLQR
jgi:hypothetical protein